MTNYMYIKRTKMIMPTSPPFKEEDSKSCLAVTKSRRKKGQNYFAYMLLLMPSIKPFLISFILALHT